jgi:hypothetical protein
VFEIRRTRTIAGSEELFRFFSDRLAVHLAAVSVHAVRADRHSYVAPATRYIRIQPSSENSIVLKNGRYRKSAAQRSDSDSVVLLTDAQLLVAQDDGAVRGGAQGRAGARIRVLQASHHHHTPLTTACVSRLCSHTPQLLCSPRARRRNLSRAAGGRVLTISKRCGRWRAAVASTERDC